MLVIKNEIAKMSLSGDTARHGDARCDAAQSIASDISNGYFEGDAWGTSNFIAELNPATGFVCQITNLHELFGSEGELFTQPGEWWKFNAEMEYNGGVKEGTLYVYRTKKGVGSIRGLFTNRDPRRTAIYDSHVRAGTLLRQHDFYGLMMPASFCEFGSLLKGEPCDCDSCMDAGVSAQLAPSELEFLQRGTPLEGAPPPLGVPPVASTVSARYEMVNGVPTWIAANNASTNTADYDVPGAVVEVEVPTQTAADRYHERITELFRTGMMWGHTPEEGWNPYAS